MKLVLMSLNVVFFLIVNISSLYAEMRYEVGQIYDPYEQGWSFEKVAHEDSLILYHASNIRVNKTGYILDGPSKYALVFNHDVGEKFQLINANTGLPAYTGTLTEAADFDGNPVSEVPDAELTISYYRITTKMFTELGYPKSGTIKNGKVAKADFSNFSEAGRYYVKVGDDVSETFVISKYILNKAASIQCMFMGFQRCGYGSWAHYPCHTKDGNDAGDEYEGMMAGAWHDCGDHIKVGSNVGFTASMLAFMSVVGKNKILDVFNGDYTDTILTDGIPDHLREAYHGVRYMVNAYNLSVKTGIWDPAKSDGKIYTGVGSNKDHNFWDLPSRQDNMPLERGGSPRPLHARGTDGLDVLGGWTAALAFFSAEWQKYDKAFADSCYNIAKNIYEFIYRNHDQKPKWEFEGLYFSDGWHQDEATFAAIALAYASKERGDLQNAQKYIEHIFFDKTLGAFNDGDIAWNPYYLPYGWLASKKGVFVSGEATVDWQNYWEVDLYAILKLILEDENTVRSYGNDKMLTETLNGKPFWQGVRDRICVTFAGEIDKAAEVTGIVHKDQYFDKTIKDKISYPPFNIPKSAYDWGWNRYMMGRAIIPFMFGEFLKNHLTEDWTIPFQNYAKYYKWGIEVVNYLCGINPWDISMIVGLGEKFPHHIHNRTACAENANTGSAPYNFIPPYGALAPWTEPYKMIEDISEKGLAGQGYKVTETCVDYSIATMLAMIMASGDIPKDTDPPIVSDINYVQVNSNTYYFKWSTNELTLDTLFWGETTSPSFDNLKWIAIPIKKETDIMGLQKEHELFITDLEPHKTYYFYIKSVDRFGNVTIESNKIKGKDLFYKFTLSEVPDAKIKNLLICPEDEHTVKIAWWTDVPTTSSVTYWKLSDPANKLIVPQDDKNTITRFHQVTLYNLDAATEYGFTATSGNDSKDSTFKTDFAFAKVKMKSAMTSGSNHEFAIFLDNSDLRYNQAYDGLIFRIYLNYPPEKFNQINGHIGVSDATLYDPESGGVRNIVAEVENNADIPYKDDGFGNYYAEIKLPKGESAKLKSGGWLYFRVQFWGCNSEDDEFRTSWSIAPHITPVKQDYPPVLPSISGEEKYKFADEYYVGLFQEDDEGNLVHLFGFLPTTNPDDPDFHQNYTMNLSISEPVQSPPITNFTVESDDEVRYLELKGHAESVGERFGYGTISKIMVNDKLVPIEIPNNGKIDFTYNYELQDGSNVINIVAIDEENCAFDNLALTVLSTQGEATPSQLTVYRITKSGLEVTDIAEVNKDGLYFTVVDLDENKNENVREEINVTIINPSLNDTEVVTLKETEPNSGEFTSAPNGTNMFLKVTEQGKKYDNTINGSSGDVVKVIYQDKNSKSDRQEVYITLYTDKSGVKFCDKSWVPLSKDFNFKPKKDSVYVRLIDFNNQDNNQLPLTIESHATGDKINVMAKKVDDNATIKVFGYGPLPLVFSSEQDNENTLYAGLNDLIIVTYVDKNDPTDISRDTLVISASYTRIILSWSPFDTLLKATGDTTFKTTQKQFTLYALGVKKDGTIERVPVKWNLQPIEGDPFKYYKANLESDSMLIVTLTGESEGKGRISAEFELDPTLKIESTGIITIVDPIDAIYVIPSDSLVNGLQITDTLYALNSIDTYDFYIGIQNKYTLVGLVKSENKLYKIGGFWSILRANGEEFIPDSLYSGAVPPIVDINALYLLGKNKLQVIYNQKKGLVKSYNINIKDPVDMITVYSEMFYPLGDLYINKNNYNEKDTIKADYNIYQKGFFKPMWIYRSELLVDTLSIATQWNIVNLKTNQVLNFELSDSVGLNFSPGDLYLFTLTRNDSVVFTFYLSVVSYVQFGAVPNPLPINNLLNENVYFKYNTLKDIIKLEMSIWDRYGNIIKQFDTWTRDNGSKDIVMEKIQRSYGTWVRYIRSYKTVLGAWDGTNINGNKVSSGIYILHVKAYDETGLVEEKSSPFYIIGIK